jgi:predicted ATP-grasp superfamily ATP-dependent carboligase
VNVLVLDGNENQAVACVRSLARAGHRVIVGANTSWSKAGWSRDASASIRYPAPQDGASEFVNAIASTVRQLNGALVLPMTERTTLPISEHRASIEAAGGRFVLPDHDVVLRAFDKAQTTALAASLGIAVPRTETLVSELDARHYAESATFPVVLKPRSSEEISASGRVIATGQPLYATDRATFFDRFGEIRRRCSAVIVQEFVAGEGSGYFALMRHGAVRAEFAHRRLRDVRPTGSGSALRVSAPLDPRVRDAGRAMLEALGWHGVAMVEFRVRPDGLPVFLEVNGRFWNSLPLAIYAGVDFPALLAEIAERGDCNVVSTYREGVRCRWFLGDVRHVVEVWRGAPNGFPGRFPARASTLANFLLPVPGTYHDNFMLRDPLPEVGDWIDFLFRRLARRRRSRAS